MIVCALTVIILIGLAHSYAIPHHTAIYAAIGAAGAVALSCFLITCIAICIQSSRREKCEKNTFQADKDTSLQETEDANVKATIAPSSSQKVENSQTEETTSQKKSVQTTRTLKEIVAPQGGSMFEEVCKSWIGNATERIFSDPLRSFLEIVVNGLDALNPDHPIGKFGMGFFSVLTFFKLEETKGCRIEIVTTFYNKENALESYQLTLHDFQGDYASLKVTEHQCVPDTHTGTTIKILPQTGQFSKKTLEVLRRYTGYLQFYPLAKVKVAVNEEILSFGEGQQEGVFVKLAPDSLIVRDLGSGFSRETAYQCLLIPSVSKKREILPSQSLASNPLRRVIFKGKQDAEKSHFLVSVGGVIVINVPLEQILIDHKLRCYDLLFSLPSGMPLTLARNAIPPEGQEFLVNALAKSIPYILDADPPEGDLLNHLLSAFEEIEAKGSLCCTVSWREQFIIILNRYLKKENGWAVPASYFSLLQKLNDNKNSKLFPCPDRVYLRLEKIWETPLLESYYHTLNAKPALMDSEKLLLAVEGKGLIENKQIILVPEDALPSKHPQAFSCGLKTLIFITDALAKRAEERARAFSLPLQQVMSWEIAMCYVEEGQTLLPCLPHSQSPAALAPQTLPTHTFLLTNASCYREAPHGGDHIFCRSEKGLPITELLKLFHDAPDSIFEEFWRIFAETYQKLFFKHHPSIAGRFSFCLDWKNFSAMRKYLDDTPLDMRQIFRQTFFYEENPIEGTFFYFETSNLTETELRTMPTEELNQRRVSLNLSQVGKLALGCLLSRYGFSPSRRMWIRFGERQLFPMSAQTSLEDLQHLAASFFSLSEYDIEEFRPFFPYRKEITFSPQKCKQAALDKLRSLISPYEAYLRTDVFPAVSEILILSYTFNENSTVCHELRKICKEAIQLYVSYVAIKDAEWKDTYGYVRGGKVQIFTENAGVGYCFQEDFFECLEAEAQPKVKEKFFKFFREIFLRRLSPEEKKRQLLDGKLTVPRLFGQHEWFSNLLSLFGVLENKGKDAWMVLRTLLILAETEAELWLLSLLCHHAFEDFLPNNEKSFLRACALALDEIRKTPVALPMHQWHRFGHSVVWDQTFHGLANFLRAEASKNYSLLPLAQSLIDEEEKKNLEQRKTWTVGQLFEACRSNAGHDVPCHDLELFVNLVNKKKADERLSVIRQCVEEATERKPIEALLLEALQNALDAIQSFSKKVPAPKRWEPAIHLSVGLEGGETGNLIIQVADPIGMASIRTLLLDFLLPHFSQKKGKENQVGQMGNGAFQIYKDAELVIMKTKCLDNGQIYLLKLLPLRSSDGKVYDVQCKIAQLPQDVSFCGTELRIRLRKKTQEEGMLQAYQTVDFIHHAVSATSVTLAGSRRVQIFLNDTELAPSIQEDRSKDILISGFPFKLVPMVSKEESDKISGWVLTGGYPFKPLLAFLAEQKLLFPEALSALDGWSLVLPVNSYTPTQSRAQLSFTDKHYQQLSDFLYEALYLVICRGPNEIFPHFTDTIGALDQLMPTARPKASTKTFSTLQEFARKFSPFFLQKSESKSFEEYLFHAWTHCIQPIENKRKQCKKNLEAIVKNAGSKDVQKEFEQKILIFKAEAARLYDEWKSLCKNALPRKNNQQYQIFLNNIIFTWIANKWERFLSLDLPDYSMVRAQEKKLMAPSEKAVFECQERDVKKQWQDESKKTSAKKENHVAAAKEKKVEAAKDTPEENDKCPLLLSIRTFVRDALLKYCSFINPSYATLSLNLCYEIQKSYVAEYRVFSHQINVNLAHFPFSDLLIFLYRLAKQERIESYDRCREFFLFTLGNAGIMNHELEHVRRKCEHADGADHHSPGADAHGESVSFEACAASYARIAHGEGALGRLAFYLRHEMAQNGWSLEDFDRWLTLIKNQEAKNPIPFLQLLTEKS